VENKIRVMTKTEVLSYCNVSYSGICFLGLWKPERRSPSEWLPLYWIWNFLNTKLPIWLLMVIHT